MDPLTTYMHPYFIFSDLFQKKENCERLFKEIKNKCLELLCKPINKKILSKYLIKCQKRFPKSLTINTLSVSLWAKAVYNLPSTLRAKSV